MKHGSSNQKILYIVRHGQTDFNAQGILQGKTIDAPLNQTGLDQMKAFYEHYRKIPFSLILTSELKRSIQSVQSFIDSGIPHIIDERISEFSWGENEGKPLDAIIINNYKKMLEAWNEGDLDACIPGGESGLSLQNRVKDFADYLQYLEADKILICTHGRTLKMLIVQLLGWDISQMESIRHSNAAMFELHVNNNLYELVKDNDLSHLPHHLRRDAAWDK